MSPHPAHFLPWRFSLQTSRTIIHQFKLCGLINVTDEAGMTPVSPGRILPSVWSLRRITAASAWLLLVLPWFNEQFIIICQGSYYGDSLIIRVRQPDRLFQRPHRSYTLLLDPVLAVRAYFYPCWSAYHYFLPPAVKEKYGKKSAAARKPREMTMKNVCWKCHFCVGRCVPPAAGWSSNTVNESSPTKLSRQDKSGGRSTSSTWQLLSSP